MCYVSGQWAQIAGSRNAVREFHAHHSSLCPSSPGVCGSRLNSPLPRAVPDSLRGVAPSPFSGDSLPPHTPLHARPPVPLQQSRRDLLRDPLVPPQRARRTPLAPAHARGAALSGAAAPHRRRGDSSPRPPERPLHDCGDAALGGAAFLARKDADGLRVRARARRRRETPGAGASAAARTRRHGVAAKGDGNACGWLGERVGGGINGGADAVAVAVAARACGAAREGASSAVAGASQRGVGDASLVPSRRRARGFLAASSGARRLPVGRRGAAGPSRRGRE